MQIARDREAVEKILKNQVFQNERIGFVPTMGALHRGHVSLVETARAHATRVVVSIFVNPRQFGPSEDFSRYPRDETADLSALEKAGADLVYLPGHGDMYQDGFQTTVKAGSLAEPLDGASRPGFFDGVVTVVTKLFNRIRPDIAVFGEKDYQQLLVVRQLSCDLDLGVEVVGSPIVREADGLAMSSRNRYLSAPERRIAGELNQIMRKCCSRIEGGVPVEAALSQGRQECEAAGLRPVDYLELRSGRDLTPMPSRALRRAEREEARLFAAVMLGGTRLIDNMPVAGAR